MVRRGLQNTRVGASGNNEGSLLKDNEPATIFKSGNAKRPRYSSEAVVDGHTCTRKKSVLCHHDIPARRVEAEAEAWKPHDQQMTLEFPAVQVKIMELCHPSLQNIQLTLDELGISYIL